MSLYGYIKKTKPAPWKLCMSQSKSVTPQTQPWRWPRKSWRNKFVRPVSMSQSKRLQEYNKRRRSFLAKPENSLCRVCTDSSKVRPRKAKFIHHIKGRGKYLLDETTFLPVCFQCHRYIHDDPKWAYERHYMLKRI